MLTLRVIGKDGLTAYEGIRHKSFTKRLVCFGESVQVYMPPKGPERRDRRALDAHTKTGIVLGYSTESPSYVIFSEGQVHPHRSIYRLSLERDGGPQICCKLSM